MKDAHLHFHDGNVIKAPDDGGLWIVSDVSDDVISAVSFDMENCTATQRLDDHQRNETCNCESYGGNDEYEGNDPECKTCHGTGTYVKKVKGWRHAKIVASTVKEFIMKGVKRQFGIS